MKLRSLIVSVAVLAVLSGIVYFVRRPAPPPSADPRLGQPLVDRATIEKTAKLTLSDQGKTVVLGKQADGAWHVTSYFDLPADFSKLSNFIGSLTEAKLDRLVTSNPERVARLEFKDTKIVLGDAAGKDLFAVTLGKTPETGGGRYVRFGDEPKAYLASLNAWLDPESKNWANAELLNLKPDDLASIEVSFPGAPPVTLTRAKKEDSWTANATPAGQRLNAAKVGTLIGSLANVRFSETNELDDPNFVAAKANLRTFKLTTFDQKTYTISLGRKPEEKKLKPPTPGTDGKSGPAALGSVADLAKKDEKEKPDAAKPGETSKPVEAKPLAPEFETIPAGPVFVLISSSDAKAPINAIIAKRAYQVSDYTFTSLPQKPEELFEAAPPPPPAAASTPKPEEKK